MKNDGAALVSKSNPNWFQTVKIDEGFYLTREVHFFEGNRSNIWLIKGATKDLIIDTGLGVCNLYEHFIRLNLLDDPQSNSAARECIVVCTHVHFDHSGGAHDFPLVLIHESEHDSLVRAIQTSTLNYVKPGHFYQQPYDGFSACAYRVPPTQCQPIRDGDFIDLGNSDSIDIIHVPGHSPGSIALYHRSAQRLFTGDFLYDCGDGNGLLDWLPTSSVADYKQSADKLIKFLAKNQLKRLYGGHFDDFSPERALDLLKQYASSRNCCCACLTGCMQGFMWVFFLFGCFRVCPC